MREHVGLFRGKRLDSGEWVEGYLSKRPSAIQIGDYCPWYISVPPLDPDDNGGYYNVDPDSIGECTTLKDKNGKLIFEGDIVKSVFNQRPYLVCFGEYTYCDEYGDELSACGFYSKDACASATDFGSTEEWAIVIGNIHDNPELLEGEREKK